MIDQLLSYIDNLAVDDKVNIISAAIGISTFLISLFKNPPKMLRIWAVLIVFAFAYVSFLQHTKSALDEQKAIAEKRHSDSTIFSLRKTIDSFQRRNDSRHDEMRSEIQANAAYERLSRLQVREVQFGISLPEPSSAKIPLDQQIFGLLFKKHKNPSVSITFNTIRGNIKFNYTRSSNPDSSFLLEDSPFEDESPSSFSVGVKNYICKSDPEYMRFNYSVRDSTGVNPINAAELYRFIENRSTMFYFRIDHLNKKATDDELEELAAELAERFNSSYLMFEADKLMSLYVSGRLTVDYYVEDHIIYLYFNIEDLQWYNGNEEDCC